MSISLIGGYFRSAYTRAMKAKGVENNIAIHHRINITLYVDFFDLKAPDFNGWQIAIYRSVVNAVCIGITKEYINSENLD